MGELLYDSHYCRLCAENNSNGELLYSLEDPEGDLSTLVNQYLPLNVKDDGKLPRTICPGCSFQLQTTVQFFERLVEGQKKLRELWKEQVEAEKEKKKKEEETGVPTEIEIQATRIQGEDGNIYMMITVPTDKGELMYTDDNQLALRMEGLEKPRRKRGRPPKPKISSELAVVESLEPVESVEATDQQIDEEMEDGARGRRRRRKIPSRYLESVAGPEMDRIFREQGVIDPEEEEVMEEEEQDEVANIRSPGFQKEAKEVIGHMETTEGQDLGQLVVISKSRSRGGGSGSTSRMSNRGRKKIGAMATCEVCGQTFPNRSKLHLHRLDHKWNFECATCREKFPDKTSLDTHQANLGHEGMMVHEDKSENSQDIADETAELLADETGAVEATEVEEEDVEEGRVMDEDIGSMEVFTCTDCNRSFTSKENLEDHNKAVHEGLKPYSCSICEKAFAYPTSLKNHVASIHENKKVSKNGDIDALNKSVSSCTCDICGKVLNHPSSVVYHKESEHNDGRRYVCNKCGKAFKHKQLLQRHQLVHSEERPYSCSTCNASFKTKANLMNHLPTHTGEKKYFCDLCGQQFAHKTSLTLHYRWHTGEKPFPCKVCGKNFSQNGNLMEHMRIHTGEKPFFCNFCGRRFTTSSQFKLHIKRHTGERPWKCEFCGKAFLHKDTWKCHVRRHRGERPYSCEYCKRGFTEQWALKKHLRIHTGEKPYTCDICNKAFSDCSNLTKHKKVHRGGNQDMKEEDGEGVVWQLVQTEGEGEEGEDQTQHIIYVTYQGEEGEEEEGSTAQEEAPNFQMLQQLSRGNNSLVLGTSDGEEVILNTLGGSLPMVVSSETPIQLSGSGSNTGTLQVASADGGMSMPVTLTMEDGQLVAHIPSGTQFLSEKEDVGEKSQEQIATREQGEVEAGEENMQIQLVTEDGRAVQLISAPNNEAGAFSINFGDAS